MQKTNIVKLTQPHLLKTYYEIYTLTDIEKLNVSCHMMGRGFSLRSEEEFRATCNKTQT